MHVHVHVCSFNILMTDHLHLVAGWGDPEGPSGTAGGSALVPCSGQSGEGEGGGSGRVGRERGEAV